MHRLRPSRHTFPAVVAVVAALLVPLFTGSGSVRGTAGSAVARAAQNDAAVAVPAPDVRFAVGSEAMNAARSQAERHWGRAACNGEVAVTWTQLDPVTNATASWRNPSDAWANSYENYDCQIELNADTDYDWPKLCTVMTHEIGHLVGLPHSDVSGDLMSPVYSKPLPACMGPEPGAPPPPAPAPAPAAVAVADASSKSTTSARTAAVKKPLRAKTKRSAKRTKRCTRRFQAGRRSTRCTKAQLRAARAARARARR